jgi:uncharacterized phage protein (TIGR01671 family)
MQREIKFRFWDKDEKKMYRQEQLLDSDILGSLYAIESVKGKGNLEIMQYTGLKGKDSREIYEGDIVSVWGGRIRMPVTYQDGYFSPLVGCDKEESPCPDVSDAEVIGNVWENPEILEPGRPRT